MPFSIYASKEDLSELISFSRVKHGFDDFSDELTAVVQRSFVIYEYAENVKSHSASLLELSFMPNQDSETILLINDIGILGVTQDHPGNR